MGLGLGLGLGVSPVILMLLLQQLLLLMELLELELMLLLLVVLNLLLFLHLLGLTLGLEDLVQDLERPVEVDLNPTRRVLHGLSLLAVGTPTLNERHPDDAELAEVVDAHPAGRGGVGDGGGQVPPVDHHLGPRPGGGPWRRRGRRGRRRGRLGELLAHVPSKVSEVKHFEPIVSAIDLMNQIGGSWFRGLHRVQVVALDEDGVLVRGQLALHVHIALPFKMEGDTLANIPVNN